MKLVSLAFLLTILSLACKKKETGDPIDCTGTAPLYTGTVKTILDTHCATSGCHNTATKAEGYDMSTYAGAKSAAGHDAFIGSVRHLSGYTAMPQGAAKLSDDDIKTLYCWVQNAMPQ